MSGQLFMPWSPPAEWQVSYEQVPSQFQYVSQLASPVAPSPPYCQRRQHCPRAGQQSYHGYADPPPTPTLGGGSSGSWSSEDDKVLQKARAKSLSWGAIQQQFFPSKTANACRKRHERLVMKKRGSEWDEDRKGRLAVAYKERREETWMPLAQQLGERWDHVEKVCMESGLKNILSLANNQTRGKGNRQKKSSSRHDGHHETCSRRVREDSGVSFAGDSPGRRSMGSSTSRTPSWQHQILR